MKNEIIEVKDEVKIGNVILEKGDKIKVLESTLDVEPNEASVARIDDYLSGREKPVFDKRGATAGFAGNIWVILGSDQYLVTAMKSVGNTYLMKIDLDDEDLVVKGKGKKGAFMKLLKELKNKGY